MKCISIARLSSAMLLSMALVGCVREVSLPSGGKDIKTISCTVPPIAQEEDFVTGEIIYSGQDTKGYLSGSTYLWSVGDKIGIVPTEGSQLYFEVEQGDVPTTTFDGGSWSLKTGHNFWAYYPLYPDMFMTKEKVSVTFDSQVQTGNNNNSHVGRYMCLFTDGTSTSTDALSFQFHHLTSFFKTYVTVPAGKYNKVEFKAPSAVFIKKGWFNVASDSPAIVGSEFTDIISVELKDVEFSQPTELTAYAVVAPVDISNIPITVTVFGEDVAYTYTLAKANPMSTAVTYAFRAQSISEAITSESAANDAFASGETDVNFAAIDDADGVMDIVLPNTSSDVSISLPLSEADMEMNISYPAAAVSYPDTVKYSGPATSNISLDTPHSTVVLNGISYGTVVARTAPNTIIVEEGVIVEELDVLQGSVTVYGTVDTIDLSDDEDVSAVVHIYGTVDEILGEDDDDIIIWHNGNVPFEDANFKAYCVQNFDTDGDGEISIEEAEIVTRIDVDGGIIGSLKGIEYFTKLKYLYCSLNYSWGRTDNDGILHYYDSNDNEVFGQLTSLDVRNNTALTILDCDGNQLSSLDVRNNTALTDLYCFNNQLSSLDISNNSALTKLSLDGNQLSSLDVSNNSALTILICSNNRLSSLVVCNNSALTDLYCGHNQLSSLVVSNNTALNTLYCDNNELSCLDANGCTALTNLECSYNQLSSLDVSGNTALTDLSCNGNQLTSLDVSNNRLLENLYCAMSTLDTLYIAGGQTIPYITENRSEDYINQATQIVVKSMPQPEAVDLGLSVKWASFNVGASAPEEYGNYYAWGEVETKSSYSWGTYKWCNGSDNTLTKYCTNSSYGTVDNKTVLDIEDDAAHVNLGGNWRMPTNLEYVELMSDCNWTWTAHNGVDGYEITSKKNGNSIFIPAAGYYEGTSMYYVGAYGNLWFSLINEKKPNLVGVLYFHSSSIFRGWSSNANNRYYGYSIRAVQEYTMDQSMEDINMGDTWQWQ